MDMKGISRIDSKHTHGWFVRVYREGKAIGKFFSDGVHGGREKALEMARQHKIDYDRENPPSPLQGRVRTKPQKNNKTGILGISETHETWRSGKKVPCFSVSWRPTPNVAKNKRFYIHNYESREAALEAAAKFREDCIKEIAGQLDVNGKDIPKAPVTKKASTRAAAKSKAPKIKEQLKHNVNGKDIPKAPVTKKPSIGAAAKSKAPKIKESVNHNVNGKDIPKPPAKQEASIRAADEIKAPKEEPVNPMDLMLSILKAKAGR